MRNGKFYEETNDKFLSLFIIGQSTDSELATRALKAYSKLILITAYMLLISYSLSEASCSLWWLCFSLELLLLDM